MLGNSTLGADSDRWPNGRNGLFGDLKTCGFVSGRSGRRADGTLPPRPRRLRLSELQFDCRMAVNRETRPNCAVHSHHIRDNIPAVCLKLTVNLRQIRRQIIKI